MISIQQLLEQKSSELFHIGPNDSVLAALEILAEKKVGALIVMDGDKLVGILSERDCAFKVTLKGRSATDTRVSEVMSATVFTVDPKTSLEQCMTEMNDRDFRHLPVVASDKVIGMVSIGDVSKELMREKAELITYLETYVNRGFRL